MPLLRIKCMKCKQLILTDVNMDYETFKGSTYFERTIECPTCESIQTWNLDDVDRSIFGKSKK